MNNSTPSAPVLSAKNLQKVFTDTKTEVKVLTDINLTIYPGQTLSIIGASGSGKSTLLHLLGGLEQPSSGQVRLMQQDLAQLSTVAMGNWRNKHLGFVYQFHHLLPELTALENVALPLRIRRIDQAQANQQALQLLSEVGLADRVEHRPSELSGGERQRVAIARALVTQPSCVLADEPTGNLDQKTAENIYQLMISLAKKQQTAFILVTHDVSLARQCDVQVELTAGILKPVQHSPPNSTTNPVAS